MPINLNYEFHAQNNMLLTKLKLNLYMFKYATFAFIKHVNHPPHLKLLRKHVTILS